MKKTLVVIFLVVLGFAGFLSYDWHNKTKARGAEPSISQYSWTDAQGVRHFTDTGPPEGATNIKNIKGHKYIAPPLVYAIKDKGAEYYKKIKKKLSKPKKKKKEKEVNNPSPEVPALNSPQRGGVYIETSNGMMEWWNNGILGIKNSPPQAD